MNKTAAFRVDASINIANGHVMRCLTLANELRAAGFACLFLMRKLNGNLISLIQRNNFEVIKLDAPSFSTLQRLSDSKEWLEVPIEQEIKETYKFLNSIQPDLLIVDHYALNTEWHNINQKCAKHTLVIDDLAEIDYRNCLVLNQNLGFKRKHYQKSIDNNCTILLGPEFALLRKEFIKARTKSLNKNRNTNSLSLLISLGGVDYQNITCRLLDIFAKRQPPNVKSISVMVASNSPHIEELKKKTSDFYTKLKLIIDCTTVAEIMAVSDLTIGGAGTTTYERFTLGLPTLLVPMAENQLKGAKLIASTGAAINLGNYNEVSTERELTRFLERNDLGKVLAHASAVASSICDGGGTERVASELLKYGRH